MTGASRGLRIGIAIGPDSAVAVATVGGVRHAVVTPLAGAVTAPGPEAIADGFRQLERALTERLGGNVAGARVHVALMPPLADVRLVRLPRLTRAEAEVVIRRDSARHFVGNGSPRVVGVVEAVSEEGAARGRAFLAAAAPTALVEAVRTAARAAGWRPESIAPAHGAWIAAAGHASRPRTVLAIDGGVAYAVAVRNGRCMALRRAPAALRDEILEALGEPAGDILVLAEPAERDRLVPVLAAAGWTPGPGRDGTAAEVAAAHAAGSRLELLPGAAVLERQRRGRRIAIRAATGAVLLLLAAGGVELWGARRELAAVRAERAVLAAQVAPLLATRDSIDRSIEQFRAIGSLETESPRWTRALFDLALLLPRDAHITSLHTTADTLVVEATGDRAGTALQALRKAGSLEDIRLVGTVERDLEEGATASERFRFRARLQPPVGRSAAAGAGAGSGSDIGGRRP